MSFVCPLPPRKVFVRAEYLYDHQRGHGEFVEGIWCSVKAIRGQALRFETYLPQFAALYDKLPISAFVLQPRTPSPDLPLDFLQIWDSLAHDVVVIEKPLLKGMRAEFMAKDRQFYSGEYLFTLDGGSRDPRVPDFTFSETAEDHKSFNVIALDNGQFAAQPNNRLRVFDAAFNPSELRKPDFITSTRIYQVEREAKWRLGDSAAFDYEHSHVRSIENTATHNEEVTK